MPFLSPFQTIIPVITNPLNSKVMNNKKKNEGQTDFSYYDLYLLDYLRTNGFEQATDEAFIRKLLPPVGNVFSAYDLSDDNFALSPEYDLLYTELTGAVVLYIGEYGV